MTSFRPAGLAVAVCALFAPFSSATAAVSDGPYLGFNTVVPFHTEAESSIPGDVESSIDYKTGWGLSGSAGYGWGNGVRTEAEFVYRHASVDDVTPGAAADGGGVHSLALMANALYDIETGTRFTPYVGVGVGGARVAADNLRTVGTASVLDDEDYAFAYQAIAGVAVELEGNWAFVADYRYFSTTDLDFKNAAGLKAETEHGAHNIMLGVRYQFGAPEAPAPIVTPAITTRPEFAKASVPQAPKPPAPVVVAIPQSYIVFFDFDQSVLTPEAKKIIASAAQDYKDGKYVRLVVTGHTDTSGPGRYNRRLSERRAQVVKDAFVALGVTENEIAVSGMGETGLRVPTTDGVREAQNRRAEIVLQK